MSTKTEFAHSLPSVMEKLMGLDEIIAVQRPVLKKPRILSENYLRRVSSIGVRNKCSDQQSFKLSIEQPDDIKNVLQVLEKLSRKKHHTRTMGLGSSEMKMSNIIPKHSESFQGSHEFRRSIPNSRIVVKPNPGKKNGILVPANRRRTLGTESVKPRFRKERTKVVGTIEPRTGLSCSDYFAKDPAGFSQINYPGKSYTSGKAKKHISERWKTIKRVKIVEPAGRSESRSRSMRVESLENGGYMSDLESVNETSEHMEGLESIRSHLSYNNMPEHNLWVGNYVVEENKSSMVTQSSRQSSKTLQDISLKQKGQKDEVKEDDLSVVNKFAPSIYDKPISEKQQDSSLHAFHVQEMCNEFFEEDTVSSQCSCTDPESLISFEEAYQPSPNSVLDRTGKHEILSSSDCFKSVNIISLHGLHMQLELLKAKTSAESSMAVSSDDDNREGSEEIQVLMSPLRLEDSRDFSYLVEVLTEAGFQNRRKQHVPKLPISYSVFEILEKKYGEQESWKRSERRLLFDRVNLGLGEILQPFKGSQTLTKSVAKRFRYSHGDEEMMEEEVWELVVNEEEELRKESEKMLLGKDDRWMELGDEIQEIGREIEDSLIDELVADVY